MNIFSKMIKFYLINVKLLHFIAFLLFFLLFSVAKTSFSQSSEIGLPFIKNYTIKDYGTDSQNFSITQDEKRIMYFGNLSGVLKFNESDWTLTDIHGWPYISANDSGKIFVASFNEFGYLSTNDFGSDKFISLKDKFINTSDFGVVNNIVSFKNHVFFETKNRLYHYFKDYVFLVDSGKTNITTFKVNDQLFINNSARGLIQLINGELVNLPGGIYFKQKEIIDILPYNDNLLIRLRNSSNFLLYDFKQVSVFETEADDFLDTYNYTHGLKLSDGSYAFATSKNGIIFLDTNFKVILHVNKMKGLNDNSVSNLYIDKSNNLWAALRNGLSRIEYPSAFTYFSSNCGIEGGVLSIIRFNNRLYAGTLSGLFVMDRGKSNDNSFGCINKKAFKKIEQLSGIVYNLIIIKTGLWTIDFS